MSAGQHILLVDLPKWAVANDIAWIELKAAVSGGTLVGYYDPAGQYWFLLDDLEAWFDKRELQRKWLQ